MIRLNQEKNTSAASRSVLQFNDAELLSLEFGCGGGETGDELVELIDLKLRGC